MSNLQMPVNKLLRWASFTWLVIILAGCGGGGGGSETVTSPSELLNKAWVALSSNDLNTAKETFELVIIHSQSTTAQKSEAYTGKGIAEFRLKESQAKQSFDQALNLLPTQSMAKLGKAELLVADPEPSNLQAAKVLLEDAMGSDPNFSFVRANGSFSRDIADVYALLSFVYLLQESYILAQEKALLALERDPDQELAKKVLQSLEEMGIT